MVDVEVEYNYDAEQTDELTIKVGDIIKNVIMSEGGWWEGELNGKKGMFPDNFVKVLKSAPEKEPKKEEKKDVQASKRQSVKDLANKIKDRVHDGPAPTRKKPASVKKRGKVVFAYEPENEDELKLTVGDHVDILKQEEEGWWEGIINGKQGMFPSNFIEVTEDLEAAETTEKPEPPESETNLIKGKKVHGIGLGNIFGDGPIKLRSTTGKKPVDRPQEPPKIEKRVIEDPVQKRPKDTCASNTVHPDSPNPSIPSAHQQEYESTSVLEQHRVERRNVEICGNASDEMNIKFVYRKPDSIQEGNENNLQEFSYTDLGRNSDTETLICQTSGPNKSECHDSDISNHSGGFVSSPIPSCKQYSRDGSNCSVAISAVHDSSVHNSVTKGSKTQTQNASISFQVLTQRDFVEMPSNFDKVSSNFDEQNRYTSEISSNRSFCINTPEAYPSTTQCRSRTSNPMQIERQSRLGSAGSEALDYPINPKQFSPEGSYAGNTSDRTSNDPNLDFATPDNISKTNNRHVPATDTSPVTYLASLSKSGILSPFIKSITKKYNLFSAKRESSKRSDKIMSQTCTIVSDSSRRFGSSSTVDDHLDVTAYALGVKQDDNSVGYLPLCHASDMHTSKPKHRLDLNNSPQHEPFLQKGSVSYDTSNSCHENALQMPSPKVLCLEDGMNDELHVSCQNMDDDFQQEEQSKDSNLDNRCRTKPSYAECFLQSAPCVVQTIYRNRSLDKLSAAKNTVSTSTPISADDLCIKDSRRLSIAGDIEPKGHHSTSSKGCRWKNKHSLPDSGQAKQVTSFCTIPLASDAPSFWYKKDVAETLEIDHHAKQLKARSPKRLYSQREIADETESEKDLKQYVDDYSSECTGDQCITSSQNFSDSMSSSSFPDRSPAIKRRKTNLSDSHIDCACLKEQLKQASDDSSVHLTGYQKPGCDSGLQNDTRHLLFSNAKPAKKINSSWGILSKYREKWHQRHQTKSRKVDEKKLLETTQKLSTKAIGMQPNIDDQYASCKEKSPCPIEARRKKKKKRISLLNFFKIRPKCDQQHSDPSVKNVGNLREIGFGVIHHNSENKVAQELHEANPKENKSIKSVVKCKPKWFPNFRLGWKSKLTKGKKVVALEDSHNNSDFVHIMPDNVSGYSSVCCRPVECDNLAHSDDEVFHLPNSYDCSGNTLPVTAKLSSKLPGIRSKSYYCTHKLQETVETEPTESMKRNAASGDTELSCPIQSKQEELGVILHEPIDTAVKLAVDSSEKRKRRITLQSVNRDQMQDGGIELVSFQKRSPKQSDAVQKLESMVQYCQANHEVANAELLTSYFKKVEFEGRVQGTKEMLTNNSVVLEACHKQPDHAVIGIASHTKQDGEICSTEILSNNDHMHALHGVSVVSQGDTITNVAGNLSDINDSKAYKDCFIQNMYSPEEQGPNSNILVNRLIEHESLTINTTDIESAMHRHSDKGVVKQDKAMGSDNYDKIDSNYSKEICPDVTENENNAFNGDNESFDITPDLDTLMADLNGLDLSETPQYMAARRVEKEMRDFITRSLESLDNILNESFICSSIESPLPSFKFDQDDNAELDCMDDCKYDQGDTATDENSKSLDQIVLKSSVDTSVREKCKDSICDATTLIDDLVQQHVGDSSTDCHKDLVGSNTQITQETVEEGRNDMTCNNFESFRNSFYDESFEVEDSDSCGDETEVASLTEISSMLVESATESVIKPCLQEEIADTTTPTSYLNNLDRNVIGDMEIVKCVPELNPAIGELCNLEQISLQMEQNQNDIMNSAQQNDGTERYEMCCPEAPDMVRIENTDGNVMSAGVGIVVELENMLQITSNSCDKEITSANELLPNNMVDREKSFTNSVGMNAGEMNDSSQALSKDSEGIQAKVRSVSKGAACKQSDEDMVTGLHKGIHIVRDNPFKMDNLEDERQPLFLCFSPMVHCSKTTVSGKSLNFDSHDTGNENVCFDYYETEGCLEINELNINNDNSMDSMNTMGGANISDDFLEMEEKKSLLICQDKQEINCLENTAESVFLPINDPLEQEAESYMGGVQREYVGFVTAEGDTLDVSNGSEVERSDESSLYVADQHDDMTADYDYVEVREGLTDD